MMVSEPQLKPQTVTRRDTMLQVVPARVMVAMVPSRQLPHTTALQLMPAALTAVRPRRLQSCRCDAPPAVVGDGIIRGTWMTWVASNAPARVVVTCGGAMGVKEVVVGGGSAAVVEEATRHPACTTRGARPLPSGAPPPLRSSPTPAPAPCSNAQHPPFPTCTRSPPCPASFRTVRTAASTVCTAARLPQVPEIQLQLLLRQLRVAASHQDHPICVATLCLHHWPTPCSLRPRSSP